MEGKSASSPFHPFKEFNKRLRIYSPPPIVFPAQSPSSIQSFRTQAIENLREASLFKSTTKVMSSPANSNSSLPNIDDMNPEVTSQHSRAHSHQFKPIIDEGEEFIEDIEASVSQKRKGKDVEYSSSEGASNSETESDHEDTSHDSSYPYIDEDDRMPPPESSPNPFIHAEVTEEEIDLDWGLHARVENFNHPVPDCNCIMGGYANDGMLDADILNLFSDLPEIFEEQEKNSLDEDWESLFRFVPIPSDILQETCQNDANSHSNESSGFQSPSPTSVLDRRSSSLRVKSTSTSPELLIPVRTRTKRPRHSTTCRWHLVTLPTPNNRMNKKVKEKDKGSCSNQPTGGRICSHCQVTQTPQWRAGPLGPNTLCNACGVRYRAGRLVPEYRPAASPTFVPSVHSNFHRKIVQMRNTSIQESCVPQMNPATYSTQAELFPVPVYSAQAELFPMHVGHVDGKMVPEAFVTEQPPAMSPPIEFVPMSSYLFDHI